jgi:hypothetical protein
MRWALSPTPTAASIWVKCGRQRLWRPAADPAVEMAGFESGGGPEPEIGMAGFEFGSGAEPGVEMAGFGRASRRYLPTVPRLMPSSRAIRRLDQPLPAKVEIECCKFTLSSFIAPKSNPGCPIRNASLKVAGFHSTRSGWF